jgi:hypothetical protein
MLEALAPTRVLDHPVQRHQLRDGDPAHESPLWVRVKFSNLPIPNRDVNRRRRLAWTIVQDRAGCAGAAKSSAEGIPISSPRNRFRVP